ncbi:MAG: glycosyltransferase [Candidatus Aminicenantes bacterium]|nr:glycosyltransferase [Candidatus Aminicenantes bacterium]
MNWKKTIFPGNGLLESSKLICKRSPVKTNPSTELPTPKGDRDLSVILVNYNGKDIIERCLDSILENVQEINHEVIVVDNHSTDGSEALIQNNYSQIRLLCNSDNLGFSKANNQGIKASQGHYILILNTDTYVPSHSIKALLKLMKQNSEVGAVGPALLRGEQDYQISFGGKVSFFSECAKKLFLNHYYRLKLRKDLSERDVTWLSGACLMTRRDILESVGMFDERFFLYFEDIDLCMRIKEQGWRLVYFPAAKIFHRGGASTELNKLDSRYHYRKSQIYFYSKHSSSLSCVFLKLYLSVHFVLGVFQGILGKKDDLKRRIRFFRLLGFKG